MLGSSLQSLIDLVPRTIRPEERAVAELPSRLVYSLVKAAVGVAARARMPMGELVELVQLAYFEEVRKRHPRELSEVAERLGLSLRSVGTLSRRLKQAFFAAEHRIQPARRVSAVLAAGPMTAKEIAAAAPDLEPAAVRRALTFLRDAGWLEVQGKSYALSTRLRSYIDEELARRIDALNNQMEIIAASVWSRFVDRAPTASGRSWTFVARPEELVAFIDETIRRLRHGAIDLEESALRDGRFGRFGVTVAFGSVEEES